MIEGIVSGLAVIALAAMGRWAFKRLRFCEVEGCSRLVRWGHRDQRCRRHPWTFFMY